MLALRPSDLLVKTAVLDLVSTILAKMDTPLTIFRILDPRGGGQFEAAALTRSLAALGIKLHGQHLAVILMVFDKNKDGVRSRCRIFVRVRRPIYSSCGAVESL